MLITTLDEAEDLIKERHDLRWLDDGWTIVKVKETQFPPLHPDAFMVANKWYIIIARYPLTELGWALND
jgi:hypothetical protein